MKIEIDVPDTTQAISVSAVYRIGESTTVTLTSRCFAIKDGKHRTKQGEIRFTRGQLTMDNTREKLIELLKSGGVRDFPFNAALADHLIANGVTIQKWIPVTERLPEDDLSKNTKKKMIRCLVYTDKGTVKPCVRQRWEHFDGKMQPWMWNKDLYANPTHWMYYPEPPKGD